MPKRPSLRSRTRDLPVVGPLIGPTVTAYREWRKDPSRHLRRLLGSLADASVVQIGSSDGERQDRIRSLLLDRPGWTALLVEPFPASFAQLRANYPDESRFRLVQAAVAAEDGEAPFWFIAPEAEGSVEWLPEYFDQLGSFRREYLIEQIGPSRAPEVEPFLTTTSVPTLTLATLFERYPVESIDLLIVDTNGFDAVVLAQFDLDRYRPKVVLFEHKHLAPDDLRATRDQFRDYRIVDLGDDLLCVR